MYKILSIGEPPSTNLEALETTQSGILSPVTWIYDFQKGVVMPFGHAWAPLLIKVLKLHVRYSGIAITQIIENSNQGKSLLSVDDKFLLHLTENGNRDICVADYAGKAVVVVDGSGVLRFKYRGHNLSAQLKYKMLNPNAIVSDINHHLLISDEWNNLVHIIDCDGKFIRFIECPCSGGISVDTDQNLVVGELSTGGIYFIKYFE